MTNLHAGGITAAGLQLRPCKHQVAGHLFEEGKAGSLVDDSGHFYKPLQNGPRGCRELQFYELVKAAAEECTPDLAAALRLLDPFAPERDEPRRHSVCTERAPAAPSVGFQLTGSLAAGKRSVSEDGLLRGGATVTRRSDTEAWPRSPSKLGALPASLASDVSRSSLDSLRGGDSGSLDGGGATLAADSLRMFSWRPDRDELFATTSGLSVATSTAAQQRQPRSSRSSKDGLQTDRAAVIGSPFAANEQQAAASAADNELSPGADTAKPAASSKQSQPARSTAGADLSSSFAGAAARLPRIATVAAGHHTAGKPPDSAAAAQLPDNFSSASGASVVRAAGSNGTLPPAAAAGVNVAFPLRKPCQHCIAAGGAVSSGAPDALAAISASGAVDCSTDAPAAVVTAWSPPANSADGGAGAAAASAATPSHSVSEEGSPRSCACVPLQAGGRLSSELCAIAEERSAFDTFECARHPEAASATRAAADGASSALSSALLHGSGGFGSAMDLAVAPHQQQHAQPQAQRDSLAGAAAGGSSSGNLAHHAYQRQAAFVLRNAPMLRAIPRFYGTVHSDDCLLLELEDVAQAYKRPSIIDIKVGFKTWYPGADERYIAKCQAKDASTTQSKLGFKICGMQVFRHLQSGYWRASKRWCKGMSEDAVTKALLRFANNEAGLTPKDIYGGPRGAIAQLAGLLSWFQQQREFCFYSSSVLIIYEGAAASADKAHVSIRLVDFAHTFLSGGQPDENFTLGARALLHALTEVAASDNHECLL